MGSAPYAMARLTAWHEFLHNVLPSRVHDAAFRRLEVTVRWRAGGDLVLGLGGPTSQLTKAVLVLDRYPCDEASDPVERPYRSN